MRQLLKVAWLTQTLRQKIFNLEDITGDAGATVFGATEKVTEVLKKINDSIRASSAGGVQMISSEDSSVNVNNDDTKYPKISLNVEASHRNNSC